VKHANNEQVSFFPFSIRKLGKDTHPGLGTDGLLVFGHGCEGRDDEEKVNMDERVQRPPFYTQLQLGL
jgi:hypothetical protein